MPGWGSWAAPHEVPCGRGTPSTAVKLFVAFVAIVALWAAYSASQPRRETPKWLDLQCREHLRDIGHALRYYAKDHGGRLPPGDPPARWVAAIQLYLLRDGGAALEVLHCPRDPDAGKLTSYRLPPGAGGRRAPDDSAPANAVIVEDDAPVGREHVGPVGRHEVTYRHEYGHPIGLIDRYKRGPDGTGVPTEEKYRDSVMCFSRLPIFQDFRDLDAVFAWGLGMGH